MTSSYFSDLFDYDAAVNRRVLDLLRGLPAVDEKAKSIFAHVLSAKKVWMGRLNREDLSGVSIWPELNWSECEALIEENSEAYRSYLSGKTEEDLQANAQYRNSKGAAFETPVRDVLIHVLIHGGYHRGQIARAVREAGAEPINTDYITHVRSLERNG